MKQFIGMLLFLMMVGCSAESDPTTGSSIPHKVGEPNDQAPLQDFSDWSAEDIYKQTEYQPFTGEFFKGLFINNTFFMKKPGESVGSYEAFPDQTARVQLVKRKEDLEKVEVVEEKILQDGEKLSVELPEKTGVFYTYSQEILGDDEQILDTDVVIYYVPPEEMNARMYVDQSEFSQEETLEVHVENWGPTILAFGKPYNLQKYSGNSWRDAIGDMAFESIGYRLEPEKTYTQEIDLSRWDLEPGKYRVIKSFDAENTDLEATLGVEFEIE